MSINKMEFQDSFSKISQNTLLFFNAIFISFISILIGFFFATIFSTILGQTGDWGILSSGFLVASLEILSKLFYVVKKKVLLYKKVMLEL
jgi:ABC-type nitrate/sulfonate/bicarbonate transport system permease component